MDDSSPPTKFPILFASSAPGGNVTSPIPTTGQPNGLVSFSTGWQQINFTPLAAGGVPPWGKDFNGLFQIVTAWLQWYQAGAPISYDNAFQTSIGGYPRDAVIVSDTTAGLLWISTTNNNLTNPDTGGAGWVPLVLPYSSERATSGSLISSVSTTYTYAGNPNGHVPGTAATAGIAPDLCWDTLTPSLASLWVCVLTGDATHAVWELVGPPPSLQGNTTFYINASTGVDLPTGGTISAPWRTLQYAYNQVQSTYNAAGFAITFQWTGAFTAGVNCTAAIAGANSAANVIWVGTNGSSVTATSGASDCFVAQGVGVAMTVEGTNCVLTASPAGSAAGWGLLAGAGGQVVYGGGITFVNCANGAFNAAGAGAQISVNGNFTISGNGNCLASANSLGQIIFGAVTGTMSGTPAFATATIIADTFGNVDLINTDAVTWVGAATGSRYSATKTSLIVTGGSGTAYFPGDSAGFADSTSVYS